MKKVIRVALGWFLPAVLGLPLAACAAEQSPPLAAAPVQPLEIDFEIFKVVIGFVRSTRGWKNDQYEVTYEGRTDQGEYMFSVIFLDTPPLPKDAVGGDGFSFTAYVDKSGEKVVRAELFE
jgi:hypothetical protein